MDIAQLFLQRYTVLYDFWLAGMWEGVTAGQMRERPHPRVNSIVWNLWHLTRVEDAGVNRFVDDQPQVLDAGGWMEKMDAPWRHLGGGMNFDEVDDLSRRIRVDALRDYSQAVHAHTLELAARLEQIDLGEAVPYERARVIVVDEGLAHSHAEDLIRNYTGWSKGKCLMNFGLTHPYQHVGEMGVIASLLGVDFD